MKNSFDSRRKKRKYALAAALVGALVLPLCSCAGGIERKAQRYLSSRYSGEFTITAAERITNETGPIPVLIPSHYWKLTANSEQFPDKSFFVYYRKNENKEWYWSDNYYSVLFRDEVEETGKELVEKMFATECIIESVWGISPWPDGTDDHSTVQDWMDAGGKINRLTIWFRDFLPDDDACIAFSNVLTNELPNVCSVLFMGLAPDGYQAAVEQQEDIVAIWDAHPDWRIGQIRYDLEDGKITQSTRY